ncbi:MAG: 3-methyladenine DNA glycosylase AlkC [Bacteroidia bacterium]|jgi:3-methyladenine DNA glycosylase AlkC
MSTALKDRYNVAFYDTFCLALHTANPDLNLEGFKQSIFTSDFEGFELKQRMTHSSTVLRQYLSADFNIACTQISRTIKTLETMGIGENFEYMFLPEYVATYGIDQFETAFDTLAVITSFTSSEFAVRPFIIKYPTQMVQQLLHWSKHRDPKVRRLASEGSRPRLPWAMALPAYKTDPTPILLVLENLKNDPDEVVRRSVANHLNDIAKDNPDITIRFAEAWFGKTPETDALVKHGCRTLLKQGNDRILKLFGLGSDHLSLARFSLDQQEIKMGNRLTFHFKLENLADVVQMLRLEYAIYLLKKNGSHSKKVFKISERTLTGLQMLEVSKSHHFTPISTRVYHDGLHKVSIILNGKEFHALDFELRI